MDTEPSNLASDVNAEPTSDSVPARRTSARRTPRRSASPRKSGARKRARGKTRAKDARLVLAQVNETVRLKDGTPSTLTVRAVGIQLPNLEEAQKALEKALQDFMNGVSSAIQEAALLEVKTFVSDDIEGIQIVDGKPQGSMRLRAMTTIELDGDITAIVPMRPEGLDETLWAAHAAMVAQAQINRTELIKLALSAAAGIVNVLKPV